jgi:hypothetical protein
LEKDAIRRCKTFEKQQGIDVVVRKGLANGSSWESQDTQTESRKAVNDWGKEAPLSYCPCSSINREEKERKRKKKEAKKDKKSKKNPSPRQEPKRQKELDGY